MTGSLLSPGLPSASGYLGTGLCLLCALTHVGKLGNYCHMYKMLIDLDTEYGIVELQPDGAFEGE